MRFDKEKDVHEHVDAHCAMLIHETYAYDQKDLHLSEQHEQLEILVILDEYEHAFDNRNQLNLLQEPSYRRGYV